MEETCLGSAGGRTYWFERKQQSAGGGLTMTSFSFHCFIAPKDADNRKFTVAQQFRLVGYENMT